jgi:hypothetical protein
MKRSTKGVARDAVAFLEQSLRTQALQPLLLVIKALLCRREAIGKPRHGELALSASQMVSRNATAEPGRRDNPSGDPFQCLQATSQHGIWRRLKPARVPVAAPFSRPTPTIMA